MPSNPSNVWEEITYPFANFNGCTIGFGERMSNSIRYNVCNYLSMLGLKWTHGSKRGPWLMFYRYVVLFGCCYISTSLIVCSHLICDDISKDFDYWNFLLIQYRPSHFTQTYLKRSVNIQHVTSFRRFLDCVPKYALGVALCRRLPSLWS